MTALAVPRICTVSGCAKRLFARGWCQMHYARWLRHGDPDHVEPPRGRTHGTISCYHAGCTCDDCRRAAREARRRAPSRLRTDLPHGCPLCPATFATPRGAEMHRTLIHDSGANR